MRKDLCFPEDLDRSDRDELSPVGASTVTTAVSCHINIQAFEERLEEVLSRENFAKGWLGEDEEGVDEEDMEILEIFPLEKESPRTPECDQKKIARWIRKSPSTDEDSSAATLFDEENYQLDEDDVTTILSQAVNRVSSDCMWPKTQPSPRISIGSSSQNHLSLPLRRAEEETSPRVSGLHGDRRRSFGVVKPSKRRSISNDETINVGSSLHPPVSNQLSQDLSSQSASKLGSSQQSGSITSKRRSISNDRCSPQPVSVDGFDFKIGNIVFGRDQEFRFLQSAFDRVCAGASEILLVHGPSGVGKSRLVEAALADYAHYRHKGFFVSGKFDQLRMNEPYSSIVTSFEEWCVSILRGKSDDLEQIASSLLEDEDCCLDLLERLIPSLSEITGRGRRDEVDEYPISACSFLRLKLSFRSLVRALVSSSRPTVFFLDDVQWADRASREIIRSLCSDTSSAKVLFVFSCRDKEYHQFRVDLTKNHDVCLDTCHLPVCGIDEEDINEMLSTQLTLSSTILLSKVLWSNTKGNLYHLIQYLMVLQQSGIIYFCNETCLWQWNIDEIESLADVDVETLLLEQVHVAGDDVQLVMKTAAYLGFRFDARILQALIDAMQGEGGPKIWVLGTLSVASRLGWIKKLSKGEYEFTHDRIQLCCYEFSEVVEEKQFFHMEIGLHLLDIMGKGFNSEKMTLLAADHLNQSAMLRSNIPKAAEEFASLNLRAGNIALSSAAFERAAQYFRSAINWIDPHKMWGENLSLSIDCHKGLAAAVSYVGVLQEADTIVYDVVENSPSIFDALDVAYVRIESLAALGEFEEAIKFTLDMLGMIRYRLMDSPNWLQVKYEIAKTKRFSRKYKDESILAKEVLSLPRLNATMKLLSWLATCSFQDESYNLFAMAAFKIVQLSYKKGLTQYSAHGFICFAALLAKLGDIDESERFYTLGVNLLNEKRPCEAEASALVIASDSVSHWIEPLVEIYCSLRRAVVASLRIGDRRMCAVAAEGQLISAICSGCIPLDQVEDEAREACHLIRDLKCPESIRIVSSIWQLARCLQGSERRYIDYAYLSGGVMDGARTMQDAHNDGDTRSLRMILLLRLLLALHFEKWDLVRRLLSSPETKKSTRSPQMSIYLETFVRGMAFFGLFRCTGRRKYFREGVRFANILQRLMIQGNAGCRGKFHVLKAEHLSLIRRNTSEVHHIFQESIDAVRGEESLSDEALLNERAASFFAQRNDNKRALPFLLESIKCYSAWGAFTKVEWLELTYHDILLDADVPVVSNANLLSAGTTCGTSLSV